MKFNAVGNEEKKSSFTIYADLDISRDKMANTEAEITTVRAELEVVRQALKAQTKRCRRLVTEYTRRLQQKEQQYRSEKTLRDDQLAKVLRALIIFEARLKQEQKFISHQLKEKDQIIKKQSDEIEKLLSGQQRCKKCNLYNSASPNLESLDSTDYQSSNLESLDSSSDIYATVSEKSFEPPKTIYLKNKLGRRAKKFQHRRSVGSYFEALKLRSGSPCSSDDKEEEEEAQVKAKITESIPVFEGDGQTNDSWYASASDQEDDEKRDVYRNNPVLECMNQILLQNINDAMSSPPKTPNAERKSPKKVKFSDGETSTPLTEENVENNEESASHGYYETPVQKIPNFYETPQSIYSNDYEQILSVKKANVYVDVDVEAKEDREVVRKPKIGRTPPALPPKPTNLVMKYSIRLDRPQKKDSESEPDYCSISELNLPTNNTSSSKKINVVAEINPPNSQDVISKLEKAKRQPEYEPVGANLVVKKCVEKLNVQLARQTPIKSKNEDIPKLPQVSEIIIPEEEDREERVAHDNYVKNNSQILKTKTGRCSIVTGTSVSTLITEFNSQQLMSELGRRASGGFDLSQNFEEFKLDEEYGEEEDAKVEPLPIPNADSAETLKRRPERNETAQERPTYEHFLERTGLSSKAILTPSRLLSNHKSVLKPKDIKLRSRVKANFNGGTIKYWSEPYI